MMEQAVHDDWLLYMSIEQDFSASFKYLSPCVENENVDSLVFRDIIISCGTTSERLLKSITGQDDVDINILDLLSLINKKYSGFSDFKFVTTFDAKKHTPWQYEDNNNPPKWWTAYNRIKHNKESEYRPIFKYAVQSLAGLLCCIMYYDRKNHMVSVPDSDKERILFHPLTQPKLLNPLPGMQKQWWPDWYFFEDWPT